MKSYYVIMLGQESKHAEECFKGGFVGADFGIEKDLTGHLPDTYPGFNREFIPIYLSNPENHGKSKVTAGLACGALHTISKYIKIGDIVLSPDGTGKYRVGEVIGDYSYNPGANLPHQRQVRWLDKNVDRSEMSDALRRSSGTVNALTLTDVSKYSEELERLLEGAGRPALIATDEDVEDPAVFALEKHLEDFLVQNWSQTELSNYYDIYSDEGRLIGQQYPTETGPIDILAISKDKRELLVIELKKGRVSDVVIGQVQRYMGYVLQELADPDQTVKGIIIGLEDDQRIKLALKVTNNIEFYRYQVSFKLFKSSAKK